MRVTLPAVTSGKRPTLRCVYYARKYVCYSVTCGAQRFLIQARHLASQLEALMATEALRVCLKHQIESSNFIVSDSDTMKIHFRLVGDPPKKLDSNSNNELQV